MRIPFTPLQVIELVLGGDEWGVDETADPAEFTLTSPDEKTVFLVRLSATITEHPASRPATPDDAEANEGDPGTWEPTQ